MAARSNAVPVLASQPVRCAIYTRKSTEEGLQQDFNTLDSQRGYADAYIRSQAGWTALPQHYDDGGFTGANIDRPALKSLLADVEDGRINCIVVYKVDRLTRSIRDLMELLALLDAKNVTLVSVTESFNTTTPAGRMTLNLLLTFAQYEREMIAERTRDKMHAARRKGKWVGGNPVLGYDVVPAGGALAVNPDEAGRVRQIYGLYLELGSLIPVIEELEKLDWRMKVWTTREGRQRGGAKFHKTTLYNLLTNVAYTARVKFAGELYDGAHARIVEDAVWNAVQEQLNRNGRRGGRNVRNKGSALLKGMVRCASCGAAMLHTYTQKGPTRYRYYVPQRASTGLEAAGFQVRCQIVWAKNTFAWGFGRYKGQFEPLIYAHVAGQKDAWYGDKTQSTLWQEKKPAANRLHPTMKPVELIERALINSSKVGDLVIDLFGGAGSTLIGCERKNRVAGLMELDPRYADVIARRWEEYTGRQATLDGDGRTFAQVRAERQTETV
ncbi:MAG: recombinase family protein [Acidobacteriota bacterium]